MKKGKQAFRTETLDSVTKAFYRDVLERLHAAHIPFLVGGAYALAGYSGIVRHTKDLDIFVKPSFAVRALKVLAKAGYETEVTYSVWLAKAFSGDAFVDLIYRSGNGLCEVDDDWFLHSDEAEVLGIPVRLCPPEECLWQKAFIMERERFDGPDVAHYILSCGPRFDWERLLRRFGPNWRVLLAHLVIFGFAYPGRRDIIPDWVLGELTQKLEAERCEKPTAPQNLCQGTLLSRTFYLIDVGPWGYRDARFKRHGTIGAVDLKKWKREIEKEKPVLLAMAGISLEDSAKRQFNDFNKQEVVR
jgi:hypothetical protein